MNWFKNLFGVKDKVSISVDGVNPLTDNEFLFYNFVEMEPIFFLEKWYYESKRLGHVFKPEYSEAIIQKIQNGEFKNPYTFPEYFNSKFDYIAIDFETANNNRISACAIGLAFVKNETFVHKKKYYIQPPRGEKLLNSHVKIHGIQEDDLEFALDFKELWEIEFSKYFNQNLIIFHNASMDLSVLKNLFIHYNIDSFNINYIDTMRLAELTGNPRKLTDLAQLFNVEVIKVHDPLEDAVVCSHVFSELIEQYPNYKSIIQSLNSGQAQQKRLSKKTDIKLQNENLDIISKYSISKDELDGLAIEDQGFLFTGELTEDREESKAFIIRNGGLIKPGITSKVNYVIVGTEYGWSKIQKIHSLNSTKNCKIRILSNANFQKLKANYAM